MSDRAVRVLIGGLCAAVVIAVLVIGFANRHGRTTVCVDYADGKPGHCTTR